MNSPTDTRDNLPDENAAARKMPADAPEGKDVVMVSTEGVAHTRRRKDADAGLEPLFKAETAEDFRSQWDAVQRSFVDDPKQAVKDGDELVTSVIQSLEESFKTQRQRLNDEVGAAEGGSTENLRVALRRYRAFFERLLAV
ncbi:MAG TPA: hypothetical protein VGI93_16925 [Steroidobacteraceae bacterium]|jgi:hypothetical protein